VNPDPQQLPVSTLPADRVFRLERGKLFYLAGRPPRPAAPKMRSRAKLRLVPAPAESSQSVTPSTEESR
jgi:hypothetical protein